MPNAPFPADKIGGIIMAAQAITDAAKDLEVAADGDVNGQATRQLLDLLAAGSALRPLLETLPAQQLIAASGWTPPPPPWRPRSGEVGRIDYRRLGSDFTAVKAIRTSGEDGWRTPGHWFVPDADVTRAVPAESAVRGAALMDAVPSVPDQPRTPVIHGTADTGQFFARLRFTNMVRWWRPWTYFRPPQVMGRLRHPDLPEMDWYTLVPEHRALRWWRWRTYHLPPGAVDRWVDWDIVGSDYSRLRVQVEVRK